MKRLQNTLYVTTPEAYLSLDGETVVVRNDDDVLGRVPLHNLEAIVSFGYRGVSPAVMRACTERNIGLCFLSRHGRFLARVSGPVQGNVLLRTEQYRTADDRERALPIAKMLLTGKLYNSRWLLEHFRRDHPQRLDLTAVGAGIDQIKSSLRLLPEAADHDTLRGIEGSACKTLSLSASWTPHSAYSCSTRCVRSWIRKRTVCVFTISEKSTAPKSNTSASSPDLMWRGR